MYKNILVPVDLAETGASLGAMSVAKQFCDLCGASLKVVSILPEGSDRAGHEARLSEFLETQRSVYVPAIEGTVTEAADVGDGIVRAARDIRADLIVMASHDPTAPGAAMGSNAAHVLTHTPCSVLSVR